MPKLQYLLSINTLVHFVVVVVVPFCLFYYIFGLLIFFAFVLFLDCFVFLFLIILAYFCLLLFFTGCYYLLGFVFIYFYYFFILIVYDFPAFKLRFTILSQLYVMQDVQRQDSIVCFARTVTVTTYSS